MSELFLRIFNMSISASWLVLAVLVLRLLLKKAPKWVHMLLWGVVAVRLIFPFSIESALSLIPSAETVPMGIAFAHNPAINSGIDAINHAVNPAISSSFAPNPGDSANPLQVWIPVAAVVWMMGMAAMVIYTAVSYGRLLHRVRTAVCYGDNIYQSENVDSPFVLGVFRPKIYLPFHLKEQDMAHILAHEQAHIRRKDHWWKPLGFTLLSTHWFNPLMWLAYVLLCRDMELACDETVIKELGNEQRADYAQALVTCSVRRRTSAACPLAFGEVGVKERVKSVMNYRKPAFWIMFVAVIVCIATAVCFLTNPKDQVKELLTPGTTWVNETHGLTFYVDENRVIEGTYTHGEPFETISIGYRFAGIRNAVFDVFAGDWETAQASAEAPLLSGILSAKRGTLVLHVETDNLGLDEDEVVFVPASVTIIGGADGPTSTFVHTTPLLSLNDVIILSQKGHDLGWSDFDGFPYIETGSGLYIRVYEINELFELWIGGTDTDSEPIYIYLTLANDLDTRIDIRDGGVTEFISKQRTQIFRATVLEAHDGTLLVEPVEGSAELRSADRITVPIRHIEPSPEPKIGDMVEIEYDGTILESYPAQLGEVYRICVVEET